jgi:hypothetical protein
MPDLSHGSLMILNERNRFLPLEIGKAKFSEGCNIKSIKLRMARTAWAYNFRD